MMSERYKFANECKDKQKSLVDKLQETAFNEQNETVVVEYERMSSFDDPIAQHQVTITWSEDNEKE